MVRKVIVNKGNGGWGGPLTLVPDNKKKYIISVTGGGIHPVAEKIAELTGTTAVDSFKNPVEKEETLAAVIDCGGTARCGTYPRMGIPTINVKLQAPSGPLAKFMTEDIFVSGTTVNDLQLVDGESTEETIQTVTVVPKEVLHDEKVVVEEKETTVEASADTMKRKGFLGFIDMIGRGAGTFINIMYQAGRETIDTVMTNIIPFMAFVATLIGIINYTGIGNLIARVLSPLAGSLIGLVVLGLITSLPFLSPLLAPGAVIASVIGLLIGTEIANGTIPAHYALPALFAINSQVGCDFAPVGMTLGEARPDTISSGVPAILFSRVITGPLAVVVAYFMSFGL
ncbi:PTS system, glucitol, sorbitol-specific IIB component and second of two IIC component [Enterococcus mundtii 3F]|uniref:PTS glucitol/sorbitol transporter subunit IIB n=1 Tax=Enterococcus mundtii TaxID=53346 RepID=UPI002302DA73|nr:PTS glucitol/sorbitol transporter subunit IIB [Enterococcus mundtii]MDA9461437.1 PTS system, glucitol, sorbitol-specific IIB component and second of two IIC component [Enterococcus mundtii 3F]